MFGIGNKDAKAWNNAQWERHEKLQEEMSRLLPNKPTTKLLPDPVEKEAQEHIKRGYSEFLKFYRGLDPESFERQCAAKTLLSHFDKMKQKEMWDAQAWALQQEGFNRLFLLGIASRAIAYDARGNGLANTVTPEQATMFENGMEVSVQAMHEAFEIERDPNCIAIAQGAFFALPGWNEHAAYLQEVAPFNLIGWGTLLLQLDERWMGNADSQFNAAAELVSDAPAGHPILGFISAFAYYRWEFLTGFEYDGDKERARREVFLNSQWQQLLREGWAKWRTNPADYETQRNASMYFFCLALANMPAEAYEAMLLSRGFHRKETYGQYGVEVWGFDRLAHWAIGRHIGMDALVDPHFRQDGKYWRGVPTNPDYKQAQKMGLR